MKHLYCQASQKVLVHILGQVTHDLYLGLTYGDARALHYPAVLQVSGYGDIGVGLGIEVRLN
jgi:hypothetical protein